MDAAIEIRHYVDRAGRDIFARWVLGLADTRAQAIIAARLARLAAGNLGDCKALGRGLFELRIAWGPGYRIYFALLGRVCVLLLCGGDKRRQAADIERSRGYLEDYKQRAAKDDEA